MVINKKMQSQRAVHTQDRCSLTPEQHQKKEELWEHDFQDGHVDARATNLRDVQQQDTINRPDAALQ